MLNEGQASQLLERATTLIRSSKGADGVASLANAQVGNTRFAASEITSSGDVERTQLSVTVQLEEILLLPFAWERVSPFDRTILEATARIPAGCVATYGEVAARAGRPGCARAAGRALGRNPWPVLLPCHRVAGADGSLSGFGKGLPAKKALLAFESSAPAARRTAQ